MPLVAENVTALSTPLTLPSLNAKDGNAQFYFGQSITLMGEHIAVSFFLVGFFGVAAKVRGS
jgi:hypothetical protein